LAKLETKVDYQVTPFFRRQCSNADKTPKIWHVRSQALNFFPISPRNYLKNSLLFNSTYMCVIADGQKNGYWSVI